MAISNSDEIKQLVAAQQQGFSLGQDFYKDIDIYQAEINNIFLNHWLYAGHVSQIPSAGDYFTFEFDAESVIVARTPAGEVKAHMNVCRHRGSRICLEPSGLSLSAVESPTFNRLCPLAWLVGLCHGIQSIQIELKPMPTVQQKVLVIELWKIGDAKL